MVESARRLGVGAWAAHPQFVIIVELHDARNSSPVRNCRITIRAPPGPLHLPTRFKCRAKQYSSSTILLARRYTGKQATAQWTTPRRRRPTRPRAAPCHRTYGDISYAEKNTPEPAAVLTPADKEALQAALLAAEDGDDTALKAWVSTFAGAGHTELIVVEDTTDSHKGRQRSNLGSPCTLRPFSTCPTQSTCS